MKIFRYIVSCFLLLMCASRSSYAGNNGNIQHKRAVPRVSFGIEGSFSNLFATYRHFNYISMYGYRIYGKTVTMAYHLNGELLVHAGYNFSRKVNLSIYGGYSGISKHIGMHPLSLRLTCYPEDIGSDGQWLIYADSGAGFRNLTGAFDIAPVFKIGSGYRVILSRSVRLDFLCSLRTVLSRPELSEGGKTLIQVTPDRVRRNDALYVSLDLGIGMTF